MPELAEAEDQLGDGVRAAAVADRDLGCGGAHAAASSRLARGGVHDRVLRGLGARNVGETRPSDMTSDAVGHAEHLGQLRRDHQHRDALRRRARRAAGAPRPWRRRRCRASARRGSGARARRASHLREHGLLLVAARELQTGLRSRPYLSCRRSAQSRAKRRSAPRRMKPQRARRAAATAALMFARSRSPGRGPPPRGPRARRRPRPPWPRVGGRMRSRLAVDADAAARPQRSMPKIARATSVRPAPTRPASADDLAARTSNETSVKTPSRVSRSTSSTTRAGLGRRPSGRARPCRPADHRADDRLRRQLADRLRSAPAARRA